MKAKRKPFDFSPYGRLSLPCVMGLEEMAARRLIVLEPRPAHYGGESMPPTLYVNVRDSATARRVREICETSQIVPIDNGVLYAIDRGKYRGEDRSFAAIQWSQKRRLSGGSRWGRTFGGLTHQGEIKAPGITLSFHERRSGEWYVHVYDTVHTSWPSTSTPLTHPRGWTHGHIGGAYVKLKHAITQLGGAVWTGSGVFEMDFGGTLHSGQSEAWAQTHLGSMYGYKLTPAEEQKYLRWIEVAATALGIEHYVLTSFRMGTRYT